MSYLLLRLVEGPGIGIEAPWACWVSGTFTPEKGSWAKPRVSLYSHMSVWNSLNDTFDYKSIEIEPKKQRHHLCNDEFHTSRFSPIPSIISRVTFVSSVSLMSALAASIMERIMHWNSSTVKYPVRDMSYISNISRALSVNNRKFYIVLMGSVYAK